MLKASKFKMFRLLCFICLIGLHRAITASTDPDNVVCVAPDILHGRLQLSHAVYRPGDATRLLCHDGFRLDGPERVVCGEDGSWRSATRPGHAKELPRCRELTCPKPTEPTFGRLDVEGITVSVKADGVGSGERYKHGSVAIYHCLEGFHLSDGGSAQRVCRGGAWSGLEPVCVRTGCGPPPTANQGYYLELSPEGQVSLPRRGKYAVGALAVYRCNPAHVLVGTDTYQCMTSGEWSPPVAPGCQAEQPSAPTPTPECPLLSGERAPLTEQRLVRGWMTDEGASGGAVVEYSCIAGTRDRLEPCRPQQMTCWRGRWLGRRPRCQPVTECIHPPRLLHGDVYGSGRQSGAQVFYSCSPRYRLEGPSTLTCDSGGCWTPRLAPVCVAEAAAGASALLLSPAAITLLAVTAAVVLLLVGLLVFVLQRRPWKPLRRPPPPPPPGPARPEDADRVALIAYPEGAQYVLPTYEEAVRSERATAPDLAPNAGTSTGAPFRPLHHARSLPPASRRERFWTRRDPESDSVSQRSVQSHQSHHSASTRQSVATSNATPSLLDSMGSTETMATSDAASTTLSAAANASVRGMCGSLASFDTSSVLNTEGVPLLEENETENADEQDSVSCGKLSSSGDSMSNK